MAPRLRFPPANSGPTYLGGGAFSRFTHPSRQFDDREMKRNGSTHMFTPTDVGPEWEKQLAKA